MEVGEVVLEIVLEMIVVAELFADCLLVVVPELNISLHSLTELVCLYLQESVVVLEDCLVDPEESATSR